MRIVNYAVEHTQDIDILHFSDLHISPFFYDLKLTEICTLAQEKRPNYICITGDLIDYATILESKKYREKIELFFKRLGSIAPVLYILGNHEVFRYEEQQPTHIYHEDWFFNLNKISNVTFLNQTSYEDDKLYCYGLTLNPEMYQKEERIPPILPKEVPVVNGKLKLLLCHSSFYLARKEYREKFPWLQDFDLILSGHKHNGLLPTCLEPFFKPGYGLLSPSKQFLPNYAWGKFIQDQSTYIISGGISKFAFAGQKVPSFLERFFPAQIENISLQRGKMLTCTSTLKTEGEVQLQQAQLLQQIHFFVNSIFAFQQVLFNKGVPHDAVELQAVECFFALRFPKLQAIETKIRTCQNPTQIQIYREEILPFLYEEWKRFTPYFDCYEMALEKGPIKEFQKDWGFHKNS